MPDLETSGQKPATPELSPRYMRRRADDDKVVSEHRKGFVKGAPAEADSFEYGRRASDDTSPEGIAAAKARAMAPPSAQLAKGGEQVDDVTPDLRRRVVEATSSVPEGLRRSVPKPVIIGVSAAVVVLGLIGVAVFW